MGDSRIVIPVIVGILILGTIGLSQNVYALNPDDMVGGTCERRCTNDGVLYLVSQTDGSKVLIGDPTTEGSLPGLAFDSSGTLWGINNIDEIPNVPTPQSFLIKINPDTGLLIGAPIPITLGGVLAPVQDLAIQPGTDVLFGTAIPQSPLVRHQLLTIDKSTGAISIVGLLPAGSGIHPIGFDPITGNLYDADCNSGKLYTIDPTDASVISSINLNSTICVTGLGVRSDGLIFGSGFINQNASVIVTIDPTTGTVINLGSDSPDSIGDLAFVPVTDIEVDIDIKPGSDPNSINVNKKKGVTPVAILGSDTFDVTTIDATSLTFGPSGASTAHDLSDALVLADHYEDVNDDGFTDLVAHFSTPDTGIAPGDIEACIEGQLLDATSLIGCDSVRTIPAS